MEAQERPLSEAEVNAIHLRIRKAQSVRSGSGWFYWIAGLSLVNSVAILSGTTWNFLAGLGITQVVDAIAVGATKGSQGGLGTAVKLIAVFLDLLIAGTFVLFGMQSRKGHRWAFSMGLILYSLDALILLAFQGWFGFFFHLWALFGIWTGYQALKWLEAHPSTPRAEAPAAIPEGV